MDNIEINIRNAVRAVIIRENQILLLRKEYEDGSEQFALPGGGQDAGETLKAALDRECREEIGTEIQIDSLMYVADRFKARNTSPASTRHLVEFLFSCSVDESYVPKNGYHPDKHQVEVKWIELDSLNSITLQPDSIRIYLQNNLPGTNASYLGLIE